MPFRVAIDVNYPAFTVCNSCDPFIQKIYLNAVTSADIFFSFLICVDDCLSGWNLEWDQKFIFPNLNTQLLACSINKSLGLC